MNRLTAKRLLGAVWPTFWHKPAVPLFKIAAVSAEHPADAEVASATRVFATLFNKTVWGSGATAVAAGLAGAIMAVAPLQAAQEEEHLQSERPAAQVKPRLTGLAKKRTAVGEVMALRGSPAGEGRPGYDDETCQVSDKTSVTDLKNCIDSFNRPRPGGADPASRKSPADGIRKI